MTQHPSLRSGSKDKQHRSVLKRFEKIEILKKKGQWEEGKTSFFGLPKVKVLRFKVKKEKAQEGAEAAKAGAAVETATAQLPTAQKPATLEQKKKAETKK